MNRKHTIQLLMASTGKTTELGLMNFLQNHGLVSDNSINLSDVPDCDLHSAIQKL